MKHKMLSLGLGVLLMSLSFVVPEPTVTQAEDQDHGCTVIDFEEVADTATGALIGDLYASQGVTFQAFGTYWDGVAWDVLDKISHSDAVCGTVPSGNKVAHLSVGFSAGGIVCGIADSSKAAGADIFFNPPVRSVAFKYVSCNGVLVEAFKSDGTPCGEATGEPTDNGKPHCGFTPIQVECEEGCFITKVTVSGVAMIDDLEFCCSSSQGCTPGYWKNHTESWTGYLPGQEVGVVFSGASVFPSLASATLLQALGFGGGSGNEGAAKNLLRAAVAALLNAAHDGVDYPRTTVEIISQVNMALKGTRTAMLVLATALDNDNNLGCPLN